MRLLEKLHALRTFEKQHLDFLGTVEDHHLIGEIGYHQAQGKPLTLKQLFLLDVGSIATVQRRLRRLKELEIVHHRRSPSDRRAVELTLSPKCVRILTKYDTLMSSKSSASTAAMGNGGPNHVCGLCDSDAGMNNVLVTFLAQGLKRGDKCLLVAPAGEQKEIIGALSHRRKTAEQLSVSEGYNSTDAQYAFLKRMTQDAKRAGQTLRLGTNMSWIFSQNLRMDAVLDIEKRFDGLAERCSLKGLCVYDARRFPSGDFLHALKCHRDHAVYPIVAG
jgi:DNA-binding MarR family transcriptional regulator